jgi:hypothetical protein
MTAAQWAYLTILSEEAGEPLDETLTKTQASKRIEALQHRTGRAGGASAPDRSSAPGGPGTAAKDPSEWSTGKEPMTAAQRSYLRTLSQEAGEPFDETLTKAQAAQRIDALQRQTGRGPSRPAPRRCGVRRTATGKRRAE